MLDRQRTTPPPPFQKAPALSTGPASGTASKPQRLEDSPSYRAALELYLHRQPLRDIATAIILGVMTGSPGEQMGINPLRLARFLADLAEAKETERSRVVAEGLAALAINSVGPRRGRPRGTGVKHYGIVYEGLRRTYKPLWEHKKAIQQSQPKSWRRELQMELEPHCEQLTLDALIRATTLRRFVMPLVAASLGVDEAAAERGVARAQRAAKSAQG